MVFSIRLELSTLKKILIVCCFHYRNGPENGFYNGETDPNNGWYPNEGCAWQQDPFYLQQQQEQQQVRTTIVST